ncbi:MAG: ubiquitin-like small modifier protein 1 [Halobacteriales archaeon]
MQVTIKLYGPPGSVVGRSVLEREVPAGATVGDVFDGLVEDHPDLAGYLLTDDGEVPPGTNVTLEKTAIERRQGLETVLEDGDVLRLLPAMEGG